MTALLLFATERKNKMNILGIDSSAVTASAAVISDGKVLSDKFVNTGLNHSETLAPLTVEAIEQSGLKLFDMDAVAVSHGPGSFTGVRIGVSFAKGLAQPMEIPCFGVSSLEAAAYPHRHSGEIIMAAMDARCDQIYAAFFKGENGRIVRLTEDDAISIGKAAEMINSFNKKVIICGDGTDVAYNYITEQGLCRGAEITVSNGDDKYQSAVSVALLAEYYLAETDKTPVAPKLLVPFYLRPSQAERELKNKKSLKKENKR